jgi:hypothetical protein
MNRDKYLAVINFMNLVFDNINVNNFQYLPSYKGILYNPRLRSLFSPNFSLFRIILVL